MKMKRLYCLLLCLALLLTLTACGPVPAPTETVDNPFTQETTAPAPSETASAATQQPVLSEPGGIVLGLSDKGYEYPDPSDPAQAGLPDRFYGYHGGEMTITLELYPTGHEITGVGFLLFVDGYPQPYRAEDDTEASYMHVFFPPDGTGDDYEYYDLSFIPVTGKAGDDLEIWVQAINYPQRFPEPGTKLLWDPTRSGMISSGTTLHFFVDPPQAELPSVQDRLISQTVAVEELVTEEVQNLTINQLRQFNDFSMHVVDWENQSQTFCLSAGEDTPVHLHSVAYGAINTDYRLVVFVDNVPISVAEEDLPALYYEVGQKIIVDTFVDLAGFDGSSLIYAVLVPRSSIVKLDGSIEHQGYVRSWASSVYYFSSAETTEELLGK